MILETKGYTVDYKEIENGIKFIYFPGNYTATLTNQQVEARGGADKVASYIKSGQENLSGDSVQYLANNTPILDSKGSGFQVDPNTNLVNEYQEQYNTVPESDKIKSALLNEGYIKDVPSLVELKGQSNPANVNRYSYGPKATNIDGPAINPYSEININKNIIDEPYEVIGGADLSVFFVMETPVTSDIGLPVEVQKKEILTFEVENALSLSYSTLREIFPVRVLGEINPRAFVRGIRTISGHIAFGIFTKDVLQHLRSRIAKELNIIERAFNTYNAETAVTQADFEEKKLKWKEQKEAYSLIKNKVQLLDDLPPFHILCMGTNENGIFSKFMIKNVAIIDENQYQGTQQPNIINKVNWVALDIIPMNEVDKWQQKTTIISSTNSIESSYIGGNFKSKINYNFEVTGSNILDSLLSDLDRGNNG